MATTMLHKRVGCWTNGWSDRSLKLS